MLKSLLTFFALSLGLSAQTLIGMPDIMLSGSVTSPSLDNHSEKTIVATLLVIQRQGRPSPSTVTWLHPEGVKPGGHAANIGQNPHFRSDASDIPVVSSTLAAVVFSDGEIRGDNPARPGVFQANVEAKFQTHLALAKQANDGQWESVSQAAALTGHENSWAASSAARLIREKNTPRLGSTIYTWSQLPATLWREK